ncbi:MAG: hypothetical protein V4580_12430 [Bacteroidota bacterium]
MKTGIYIILGISLCMLGCKRKRKVNVEGTVTDVYTGMPASNVDLYLYSQISSGSGGGEVKSYQQTTDGSGHFSFKDAFFSKPGNEGWITVKDDEYRDTDWSGGAHAIDGKSDIKFIGKTKLTRNIEVICISKLQLSLNLSPNIQWVIFYRKFEGSGNVPPNYSEFTRYGNWPQNQSSGLINELIGYSNGKNIIKSEYFDQSTQTSKTQYDTIISNGCGTANNYTITLN